MNGYHGRVLHTLQQYNIVVGDHITIHAQMIYTGRVMSRYDHSDDAHVVLKLDNGYNVGVSIHDIHDITKTKDVITDTSTPAPSEHNPQLPNILLLSTGGTIASRIDYRTGAVTPALEAGDLVSAVPELYDMANMHPVQIMSEYSENITPEHWVKMAQAIHDSGQDYDGIIVAHGTDTMHYTSAYLSFALSGFPRPIILTGAQRSSDRASSDAASNLMGAVAAIKEGIPRGVYIAMHHDLSDGRMAIHLGTRVRKSHTSGRGAFHTIGSKPAYTIQDGKLVGGHHQDYYHGVSYNPSIGVDRRAVLIKYYPGYDHTLLESAVSAGCQAVIFEGTGLGHVGREVYGTIQRMLDQGIFVGMTSQCIEGRVAMTVYESGRDLLHMGIVPLGDMLPETALVKAMWILSGDENLQHRMPASVASEVSS